MNEQEIKALRAGDGVVGIHTGNRAVVRYFENGRHGIEYTSGPKRRLRTPLTPILWGYFRRETFREFLTRPTGFGETRWRSAIPIFLFALLLITVGAVNLVVDLPRDSSLEMSDGWAIALLSFGVGMVAIMFIMAWRNYKKLTV